MTTTSNPLFIRWKTPDPLKLNVEQTWKRTGCFTVIFMVIIVLPPCFNLKSYTIEQMHSNTNDSSFTKDSKSHAFTFHPSTTCTRSRRGNTSIHATQSLFNLDCCIKIQAVKFYMYMIITYLPTFLPDNP